MVDAHTELSRTDLPERVKLLGFRDDDREALLAAVPQVIGDGAVMEQIQRRAETLAAAVGRIGAASDDPWDGYEADRAGLGGDGLVPILALLATVDRVRGFHAERGVPDDVSWRTLSDLGQQVWVHRLTFDRFGLHTHGWLRVAWSGALYWLGRLQFNLQRDKDSQEWQISTHIPRTGPLTPESVDASFTEAAGFFARHFPDFPATELFCSSWLLDPELAAGLPADSNMARFQRRWTLRGEPRQADGDALFFTFARRGDFDLDSLPRDTTLQRLIIDRLRSGGHWHVCQGSIPIEPYRRAAGVA